MSSRATAWAWAQNLEPRSKLVLVCLADSVSDLPLDIDDANGYVNVGRAAHKCGLDIDEFLGVMHDLGRSGHVIDQRVTEERAIWFSFPLPTEAPKPKPSLTPEERVRRQWDNQPRNRKLRILSELIDRDGEGCRKCGSTEQIVIDHIVPIARGGTNALLNLQLLCWSCNSRKGARIQS